MNPAVIFTLSFLILISTVIVDGQNLTPCLSGDFTACGVAVGTAIFNSYNSLHSWNDYQEIKVFGTTCTTQVNGGFFRWKWNWIGKFQCPSISPTLTVNGPHWVSRSGTIEKAIQDFIQQALAAGVLSREQAQNWQGHL